MGGIPGILSVVGAVVNSAISDAAQFSCEVIGSCPTPNDQPSSSSTSAILGTTDASVSRFATPKPSPAFGASPSTVAPYPSEELPPQPSPTSTATPTQTSSTISLATVSSDIFTVTISESAQSVGLGRTPSLDKTPASTPTIPSTRSSSHSNNVGAIVGGILGAVIFLMIATVCYILLTRRRRRRPQSPSANFRSEWLQIEDRLPCSLKYESATSKEDEGYGFSVFPRLFARSKRSAGPSAQLVASTAEPPPAYQPSDSGIENETDKCPCSQDELICTPLNLIDWSHSPFFIYVFDSSTQNPHPSWCSPACTTQCSSLSTHTPSPSESENVPTSDSLPSPTVDLSAQPYPADTVSSSSTSLPSHCPTCTLSNSPAPSNTAPVTPVQTTVFLVTTILSTGSLKDGYRFTSVVASSDIVISTVYMSGSKTSTAIPRTSETSHVGAVVGGALGAIIIVMVFVVFLLWRRRRKQAASSTVDMAVRPKSVFGSDMDQKRPLPTGEDGGYGFSILSKWFSTSAAHLPPHSTLRAHEGPSTLTFISCDEPLPPYRPPRSDSTQQA
ncbi:hypothetical protein CONPUDRAFT_77128 [Coniophora puteana RWD-64-598 SS2]|uniref:Mid2 domain-containing protein n=1 Tax=Coniophora puteana (strain RWD-64-598) TaxID=741705 RepID=A0A5M3M999_CONPW|nr:uncharacterized protein CONPUDRAFT_77128 [Coniophora puteana RWD-64-598 SS2]EIW75434.1 hypothetical protein CONPUDRAFT_77128 [Coniophora puteana RWD-64-598 SS2]